MLIQIWFGPLPSCVFLFLRVRSPWFQDVSGMVCALGLDLSCLLSLQLAPSQMWFQNPPEASSFAGSFSTSPISAVLAGVGSSTGLGRKSRLRALSTKLCRSPCPQSAVTLQRPMQYRKIIAAATAAGAPMPTRIPICAPVLSPEEEPFVPAGGVQVADSVWLRGSRGLVSDVIVSEGAALDGIAVADVELLLPQRLSTCQRTCGARTTTVNDDCAGLTYHNIAIRS